ncbi:CHC2 zinc finger domain-containing protein [Zooshikella harenae]|uniref:Toprim domain-containing protein n=1 Tax=Zooshikella harenae TaxID=2827238 RepID=A0ABS5ZCX2_9GAMM|nr:CHC2 zinc finger domain-containing protein [Zooshikella harenae]MBU2711906.1 toprim domain-containing protein [Zooshikella harenae]
MARLADDVISRIKQDVSLLRLVESQGHNVTKQGKDYVVCCPFHDEKTPSCIISPKTNLFNCFGCGTGGSVIDWVMKTQSVSFRFACEMLQKDLGLVIESSTTAKTKNTTTKLTPPLAANADSQTALRQVIDYYHETFKQSPEVIEYLRSRGLEHPELIDRFKLGFANRTLGYRLPEKNRKAGAELRGKLQEIGILRDSGHEHFNGSLVVPIIDENGVISEVYGRKILGQRLRKGTAQHLYLPGPHNGVWNVEAFKASNEIILCEALIDAMTFWVHGFRNVTASYGTSGFTSSHLAAFKQYEIKRVLIAYDRDEAGNNAAEKLAKELQAECIDCFRILLPKGMDVNEYAQQVTPAQKTLGLVIRKAEFMGAGKAPERQLDMATQEPAFDPDTGEIFDPEQPEVEAIPETINASPLPEPADNVTAEVSDHETIIELGDRRYRVRGISKNMSYDQLKVNVLVSRSDNFYVDTLDIYSARHRAAYIKQASIELGLKDDAIKKDLGKVLLKLEELQEKQIKGALEPEEKKVTLSDEEQSAALELLKDPSLLSRILEDFNRAGVVGEETNKLVGYLAGVSRKLDKPLAVIIQSSSAAGKSSLMDAVLNLMPEEERVQYSAMTGQSLFYMGETNLKNKILAIAEEEGAENASYALKLLQSEGEVTIASTGKDATTGNLTTQEYRVEGPVMLFLTTTAIDIDEELMNRCLVLTVNENREQTEAIHSQQRLGEMLEGLLANEEKQRLISLHRNAQRLLRPLKVVNPYANQLSFLSDKTRSRRDHMKYLTLIRTIALLHQYQREIKTVTHQGKQLKYIETTLDDIDTANRLANEILGRTLDELPPQTRRLLMLMNDMVKERCTALKLEKQDYRFSRRDVREHVGWTDFQIKTHMRKLEQMEYVLVHRGGRGQSFVYELMYNGEGKNGETFLMGLADVKELKSTTKNSYDEKKEHPSSPQVATKEPSGRLSESTVNKGLNGNNLKSDSESTYPVEKLVASHHNDAITMDV